MADINTPKEVTHADLLYRFGVLEGIMRSLADSVRASQEALKENARKMEETEKSVWERIEAIERLRFDSTKEQDRHVESRLAAMEVNQNSMLVEINKTTGAYNLAKFVFPALFVALTGVFGWAAVTFYNMRDEINRVDQVRGQQIEAIKGAVLTDGQQRRIKEIESHE